jgi:hypothetical protein
MPNIMTIRPEQVREPRKLFYRLVRGRYGGVVPGVFQVLAVDLRVARPVGSLYRHLHLRRWSSLSRLRREMLATVVNGKVGAAPEAVMRLNLRPDGDHYIAV